MKKYQDTDYLHASARVRTLETRMLKKRDLQKMIDAQSFEEAFKVLNDAGIAVGMAPDDYEKGLTRSLEESYRLVEKLSEDHEVFSIFRFRYDGHNLKTLIKSRRINGDSFRHVLSALGNVSPEELSTAFEAGRFTKLEPALVKAAVEATEVLAKTADPQAVDIIIDKAVLETMAVKADEYDCAFLTDYVTACIDIANIRCAVRIKRMNKDVTFLNKVLAAGGKLDRARLTEAFAKGMEDILAMISASAYGKALEPALEDLRNGAALTRFEQSCDVYTASLIARAKTVAFGIEPVIAYLFAKECEIKAARIVLASKAAGVSPEQIDQRLQHILL